MAKIVAPMIDLQKLTVDELRNLKRNASARGREDLAMEVAIELANRGVAKSDETALIHWNQERVRIAMAPFAEIARGVIDNSRTPYTEAGGRKIGTNKSDPNWMWVDTYSAVKNKNGNAVFVCHIKKPGAEPTFEMQLDGALVSSFSALELANALIEWRRLVAELNR